MRRRTPRPPSKQRWRTLPSAPILGGADGSRNPTCVGLPGRRGNRTAATGQAAEPGVDQHLSRCADCRRAVLELQRELGYSGGHRRSRALSLPVRRRFWPVLLVLALVAAGRWSSSGDPTAPSRSRPARPSPRPPSLRLRRRATPCPAPGGASAEGGSIDAQIVATIRNNQTGVRMCYERALKRDDGLALRVDVNVRIRSTGAVEQVSIDGPAAPALATCIRNVVMTWQFPQGPEAMRPLSLCGCSPAGDRQTFRRDEVQHGRAGDGGGRAEAGRAIVFHGDIARGPGVAIVHAVPVGRVHAAGHRHGECGCPVIGLEHQVLASRVGQRVAGRAQFAARLHAGRGRRSPPGRSVSPMACRPVRGLVATVPRGTTLRVADDAIPRS